ncbi:MAG: cysteine desulfurase family protein [Eubacteriales bacterium]
MEVYFDNAATTKPLQCVIKKMIDSYEEYGNPSSLHNKGIKAELVIKEAKDIFSNILKVDDKELYFTSGGTESNNLAIIGTALANRKSGKHIITSAIEHPSVINPVKFLEEEYGFDISIAPVDKEGLIDIKKLEDMINEKTILVSFMHVNNEIGSVQNINDIAKIIKNKNQRALFHVDAIQSFGKYKIYPKRELIDLLSISSHKIHGPKGIGLLYVNNKVKIKPILYGGEHQRGLRSGTENVPGIASFALASNEMYKNINDNIKHLYKIKTRLINGIINNINDVKINGMDYLKGSPNIVSLRFKNIKSEVLLHTLEKYDIYVSTGSACSSHKSSISQTLKALKLDNKEIDETLRFSFSIFNTEDDVDHCIKVLKKEVPFLRKYVRGGK